MLHKKRVLWIAVAASILTFWVAIKYISKPPVLPIDLPAAQILDAKKLLEVFLSADTVSQKNITNQILQVNGIIQEIAFDDSGNATIILETGDPLNTINASLFFCDPVAREKYGKQCDEAAEIQKKAAALKSGNTVSIKGKCIGFLDMSGVVLNQCTLIP
jgi:hypothetical protein